MEPESLIESADERDSRDPGQQPPADEPTLDEEDTSSDELGPDGQPIGPDNIREGKVRGLMGGPNQTQGEGQGG
jgi:hypothetical protein